MGSFRDLEWLGVDWEKPVRRQSEHFADYAKLLERLIDDGLCLPGLHEPRRDPRSHRASRGRGRAWPRDPDGVPLYPGLDKALAPANASGASPTATPSPGGSTRKLPSRAWASR